MRLLSALALLLAISCSSSPEPGGSGGSGGSAGSAAASGGDGGSAGMPAGGGSGGDGGGVVAPPIHVDWCDGGCTVTPGPDDSSAGTSTIPNAESTVTASALTTGQRAEVLACLRELFAGFDVSFTESDPGDVPHRAVMIGARPQQLGQPSGVLGVAPFDCQDHPTAIVFAFAEAIGDDTRRLCEIVAQQLAAAAGAEPEFACEDVTSYLTGCGNKSFLDSAEKCGALAESACTCGGDTQNSHALLLERLGPSR